MDFYSVIDTGALVWDLNNLEKNEKRYYALTALFIDFLKIMEVEQPKILLRTELRNQILDQFPWESKGIPNFWELSRYVSAFLANAEIIQFDIAEEHTTTSNPNVIYEYYNDTIKTEVGYLITEMHSSESNIKYFTFCPIWGKNDSMITKRGESEKSYDTIVHCTDELQTFLENLKPKFLHSRKHNKLISRADKARGYRLIDGKEVYPFSANYSNTPDYAQSLLELSITHELEPGKLYYYDHDNTTFICFMKTGGRIYHGFDVPQEQIHEPIRSAVMNKFDEQKSR